MYFFNDGECVSLKTSNIRGRCGVGDPSFGTLTRSPSLHLHHGEGCDSRECTCCAVWLQQLSKWLRGKQFPKDREESCQGWLRVKFACQNRWCIWVSLALTFLFRQLSSHFQGFHNFAATYPLKGLFLSHLSTECGSREMMTFKVSVFWIHSRIRTDGTTSLSTPPPHLADFQRSIPSVHLPLYLNREGGLTLSIKVSTVDFYLGVARRRI